MKADYRIPRISNDVGLNDFNDDEIAEYLRHRGMYVSDSAPESVETASDDGADVWRDGLWIAPDVLTIIKKLALCGQYDQARDEIISIISDAIARKI